MRKTKVDKAARVIKVMKQFRLYPETIMRLERLAMEMGLPQTRVIEKAIDTLAAQRGIG